MNLLKNHQLKLSYEQGLWDRGKEFVAGIDEVGKGSFAGPLVAAAVVFSPDIQYYNYNIRIDDSKKLTKKQRELADKWIRRHAISWGIGEASVYDIDRTGIVKAGQKAFRKAVLHANNTRDKRIDFLLIDAFYIPFLRHYPISPSSQKNRFQRPIIKGDQKSISIAAASIIAKVYRDNIMEILGKKKNFKGYGWDENKGYGTKKHQQFILTHGPTRHHRKQFVATFLNNNLNNSSSSQAQFGA